MKVSDVFGYGQLWFRFAVKSSNLPCHFLWQTGNKNVHVDSITESLIKLDFIGDLLHRNISKRPTSFQKIRLHTNIKKNMSFGDFICFPVLCMHVIIRFRGWSTTNKAVLPVGTPAPERVVDYCSGPSLLCVRQLPPRGAASHTDTLNSAGGRSVSVCAG